MVKEICVDRIKDEIARMCVQANRQLPCDIAKRLEDSIKTETHPVAVKILEDLKQNLKVADELRIPICQDTGMVVVFMDIGQDVHFTGGSLEDAVNEGVRQGYKQGLLRMSVMADPLRRVNTSDNTPAIIHTRIVPGNRVKITVAPKGFGSENMSGIKMLTPATTREDVIAAVVDIVKQAASNPCPPMIIGVGIGGDFEMCALLAKKALCRSLDSPHPDPYYAQLERDMLGEINKLNIGPQGFGGKTTALGLNIETFATHIAGLPVAVNIGCHVTRHVEVIID